MSLLIVAALLALLVVLSLPTLQQITANLRALSDLSESATGDMVKTIDLPGSGAPR